MLQKYRFSFLLGVLASGAMLSSASAQTKAIATKAVGGKVSPEIPKYVSTFEEWGDRYGFSGAEDNDWLLLGFQSRLRVENVSNFYRVDSLPSEGGAFTRNLIYFGIQDIIDPVRFTIELEDSRREGVAFPTNTRQTNALDFLQAYVELYFEDGIGGQVTSFQAGRFTIDAVDRRLIARNRFRNSANTFDGVRFRIGDDKSPWVANFFATRPVEANQDSFDDRSREERAFYGAYATIRGYSPSTVLEPFYYYLDDDRNEDTGNDRSLHTAGVRAYGQFGDGYDYDVNGTVQWGELSGLDHFAYFFHAEVGRTFNRHPWKPRVAAWLNYGSGDDDASDNDSGRFTELFGAPFGLYGFTRLFTAENTINPVVALAFKPATDVKVELYARSYFLASDTDAWVRGGRRDVTGESGSHLGEEIDLRVRWQATDELLLNLGGSYYFPGEFVSNTGESVDSSLIYLQATYSF